MFNRKSFFLSILFLMALLIVSCVRNQFTVEFNLPQSVNQTYRTLYYASDSKKGWVLEGIMQTDNGKGTMQMATRNPTIVYIFSNAKYPVTFFYAERGDKIVVTGEGANPATWNFDGNKINEELSEWRKSNKSILINRQPGNAKSTLAVNEAVRKYVDAHPDNPVSTILLLEYFDRRADEDGFVHCLSKLKGDAADGKWREIVSRNDMLMDPGSNDFPKEIILNTVGTGCDTVRFGRVPVLLNFSRSMVQNYRENTRELRRIARESGDSSSRIIANILLEPDSMQRWQNARYDSLRNVVEGWAPLGLSDTQISQLGVRRLPFMIVVDRQGKVVYRGDDLGKASEEFKRQF